MLGALRFVKKDLAEVKIVVNGCGAAGSAIGKLLHNLGAKNIIMLDSKGAIYEGREGSMDMAKAYLAKVTNTDKIKGDLGSVTKGADVLIGVSQPNVFTPEIISSMPKYLILSNQCWLKRVLICKLLSLAIMLNPIWL